MDEVMTITIKGDTFTEDEIAAVHVDPVTRGYWIILSHYSFTHGNHKAEEYHVNPGDPEYPAMDELYRIMYTTTADTEYDDVVYFRARHAGGLRSLYEYLESNHYAFTFLLGATRDNYLRVFRDQRKIKGRSNRRVWMEKLISEYATQKLEEDEETCCVCGKGWNNPASECECICPYCEKSRFNDQTLTDHGMCYDCHKKWQAGELKITED